MTGGYHPTSTPVDSSMVRAHVGAFKRVRFDPLRMSDDSFLIDSADPKLIP
jgi:hypothetical protein